MMLVDSFAYQRSLESNMFHFLGRINFGANTIYYKFFTSCTITNGSPFPPGHTYYSVFFFCQLAALAERVINRFTSATT